MAFCNKLGGLLKHGVAQNGNVPVTSMLGSLRYMSTKLFVGGKSYEVERFFDFELRSDRFCLFASGLSWGTDDQSLRDAFAHFGEVVDGKKLFNFVESLGDYIGLYLWV